MRSGGLLVAGALLGLVSSAEAAPSAAVAQSDHVRVVVSRVEVAKTRPDGSAWDPDGSPPELRLNISVGNKSSTTTTVEDYQASFKLEPFIVAPGTKVVVEVLDVDGRRSELIDTVSFEASASEPIAPFSTRSLILLDVTTQTIDVWEIPKVIVAVAFEIDDAWLEKLEASLAELNERIADMSDGQIRIKKFVVRPKPWSDGFEPEAPGVILLTRSKKAAGACTAKRGHPSRPANIEVAIDGDLDDLAEELLHQFGHAYLGLEDSDDADGACFMNGETAGEREACRVRARRKTTEDTTTPHADCWSGIRAVLQKDLGLRVIETAAIEGPAPRGAPAVELSYGKTIDLSKADASDADGGSKLDPATIDRVLSRASRPLSTCASKTSERKVRVDFAIRGKDGKVTELHVNNRDAGVLHRCVRRALQQLEFPKFDARRTNARFEMSR